MNGFCQCHCPKCDPIISVRITKRISNLHNAINFICTELIHAEAEQSHAAMQYRADKYAREIDNLQCELQHHNNKNTL